MSIFPQQLEIRRRIKDLYDDIEILANLTFSIMEIEAGAPVYCKQVRKKLVQKVKDIQARCPHLCRGHHTDIKQTHCYDCDKTYYSESILW